MKPLNDRHGSPLAEWQGEQDALWESWSMDISFRSSTKLSHGSFLPPREQLLPPPPRTQ